MKVRYTFVSNSSSSSCIISLCDLSEHQLYQIANHIRAATAPEFKNCCFYCDRDCPWAIKIVESTYVVCYTDMTNFDMRHFLQIIGVDSSKITWVDRASLNLQTLRRQHEQANNHAVENEYASRRANLTNE